MTCDKLSHAFGTQCEVPILVILLQPPLVDIVFPRAEQLNACADPTQVVGGYIASLTSPPDARYSPLRPPLKRGPRTYPMVRALVLPLLDAPEIQKVRCRV